MAQQRRLNISRRSNAFGICSEPYCHEPSVQNTRRNGVTDSSLCKKHRGQVYKIRHRRKSEQLATELETCREIFSGSPEPIPCQSLPQLLEEIMTMKRLELIKQPSLQDEHDEFQQYRQQYSNIRYNGNSNLPMIKRSNSKTEQSITYPTNAAIEIQGASGSKEKNTTQTVAITKNPYDRIGNVDESLITQARNKQQNALKITLSSPTVTKSAFYQTKAGGPNALISVRSGTVAQSSPFNGATIMRTEK